MSENLKEVADSLASAFEQFKAANDDRLAAIEKKGHADPLLEQKVNKINKINEAIDGLQKKLSDRVDGLETRLNRPGASHAGATNAADEMKAAIDFASQAAGRPVTASEIDLDAFRSYKSALGKYVRKGDRAMGGDEYKALSVGSDPNGGYWVSPDMSGRIVQKVFENSPIRQLASTVTIGTDSIEGPTDLDELTSGWVGEMSSRTETTTPSVGTWRITVFEQYAMPKVTQKLLDDAAFPVESWLEDKIADKFARTENAAFLLGDGVGKPRGLLTYATAATGDASRAQGVLEHVATGTSGGFGTAPNGSDKLIDLVHKLKPAYRQGASFITARGTVAEIRKLKANGEYIWLPSMMQGQPSTLLGFPVVECEDMPAIAANSLSLGFGNLAEGYQIVDRQGVRILRDPFTAKPFVVVYATKRVGGDVLNFDAVKLMKFGS